jgi:CBS domain containing-hemolysin-like protein
LTVVLVTALSQNAWLLLVACGCLGLAFLFALFENALEHHSHVRLLAEAKRRGRLEALTEVLRHEDDLLFATKMLRALTQVLAIAAVAVRLAEADPSPLALVGWTLSLALAFLLFNVAGPHLLGRRVGHAILLRGLVPYARIVGVFRRPAVMLQRIAQRITGSGPEPPPEEELADELMSVVEEGAREGTLAEAEKEMIEGIMDMRDVSAEHVMTPRTEVVSIPVNASYEDAIAKSQERGLSRLPVYRGTTDEIIGVLYMKDLLRHWGGTPPPIEKLMRRPFFVPESKNVGELLSEMKASQIHLAIVLDEYGGTAGVVSIEDIIEEIVGEIADEHERATPHDVVPINENAATVEGRTHIDDLNDAMDLDVPESEEYETVGGLLFSRLGRVPETGEHYDLDGVRFTVLEADERKVSRVKVTVQRG